MKRGGSRFYVDKETREKVPGVTSVIDMVPKDFLKYWVAKITAEQAVENLGAVVTLAMRDPSAAVDMLKRTHLRTTGEAADIGTEAHNIFERLAKGEKVGRLHPDMELFANGVREFLDRYQPEFLHIEDTVWSDTHRYAGSFDAIAKVDGEVLMVDAKTTRSGVHAEVALQLSAYMNADRIVTPDGDDVPLPPFDGAAVFHFRPDGWQFVPIRADAAVFQKFLSLREVFDWVHTDSDSVIGKPDYSTFTTTGSERRASKK
ncbi:hypothetical protein EV193_104377 [Herbihabitans rhizosphaerae]|uniref:PD-(D/E)XK nuclease superfamily protein n=2 Tax=Herbihabitans rhizosphaerae TaxID=1872711 RepID=A0A4Q7KTL1_9PSEU|nr:hypothetical protein EV193_104377 [Herbihabitans rhizosphaerae]